MSSPLPKIEESLTQEGNPPKIEEGLPQENPPNNQEPTQEDPPKKIKKATRSKKWSFHYKPGFTEEEMYSTLLATLRSKDFSSSSKHVLKDALINRNDRHIYISLKAQVNTNLLKGISFIIASSITSWSHISDSTLKDLEKNFPGYEKWDRKRENEEDDNPEYDKIMDEFIMQQQQLDKDPNDENENRLSKQIFEVIYSLANGGSLNDFVLKAEDGNDVNTTIEPLRSLYQNFEKFVRENPFDESLLKKEYII